MVLVDSADAFVSELERMFALCRERGAGTVYITLKKVLAGNKQATNSDGTGRPRGGGGGRREGWLARAKISNKKTRKVSALVSDAEVDQLRERLASVKKSAAACTIAGATKKRGHKKSEEGKNGGTPKGGAARSRGT